MGGDRKNLFVKLKQVLLKH